MSVSRESFTSSLVVLPFSSRLSTSSTSARAAGQFLVADRVDVELVAGDVLGLGALGGLEVDDRRLAGVQPGDQVDPAVDRDAGRHPDLDLLLGVQGVLQPGPVLLDVPPDGADRGAPQVGSQGRIRERRVQVLVDQVIGVQAGDDVAVDGALVDLGHHVVDGLAVAEGLVDRRVEAVQEPELELVRALEEVLQVAEAERDLWHLVPRPRVEPVRPARPAGSVVRKYWFFAAKSKNGDRARYIAESPGE